MLDEGRVSQVLDPRLNHTADLQLLPMETTEKKLENTNVQLSGFSFSDSSRTTLQARQLVKAERRDVGLSGRKHLFALLRTAGGVGTWLPLIALAIINDVLGIGQNALLARWSSHVYPHMDVYYAIGSISISMAKGVGLFAFSAILIYAFAWKASASVHERLFNALLQAPLQVLQAIPTGRILNRFTEDMERFDMDLAGITHKTIKMTVSIAVMLAFTLKEIPALSWALLALVPIFYGIQWRLAKFLSDAKKLNSIWSSPVLTMVNDSEHAVTIIRAFGAVGIYNEKMRALQTQKRMAGMTEYAAWLLCRSVIVNSSRPLS